MTNNSTYSIAAPFGWLAASGGVLLGLLQVAPGLASSIACAAVLSIATVVLASKSDHENETVLVPFLGAVLFGFLAWITISIIPSSSAEAGASGSMVLTARSIVVISAAVLLMPILAFVEMLFSVVAVQALARMRGQSVLSGELHVASMIGRKFGGVFGAVHR